MEVAQVRDRVTHAIIGGKEAESMGIADDPAFYHMLSSTLYSDERRAVIRETLCNAWDAHIEAGCTDKALEVILTSDKLVIQDFGLGIPKAQIRPIYGIYGASTKKTNSNVTGGFGLGCKSPFAYGDHFEVISCNGGEKTIYRMSKSSGAVMGKPSIQEIVSVPTTETGITVTIAVKNSVDHQRFSSLIKEIASHGEMKVNFNGTAITMLPFSKAKYGYLIVKDTEFPGSTDEQIKVRYGNVIYPVATHDDIHRLRQEALKFLGKLTKANNSWNSLPNWVLILQAEPNTISVTPSRESLSMSEHTVATLKQLLEKFNKHCVENVELRQLCQKMNIENIRSTEKPKHLLTLEEGVTNRTKMENNIGEYITNIKDAAGHILLNAYPVSWKNFHRKMIDERFKVLINSGFGNRGLFQTYRAERNKHEAISRKDRYTSKRSTWFARRLLAPVLKAMKNERLLSPNNFGVWDDSSYTRAARSGRGHTFICYKDYIVPNIHQCLPYTRGVVILGYSRLTIAERAYRMLAFTNWYGNEVKNLAYIVSRSPAKVEAAKRFFTDLGFYVVDTTARQSWDEDEIETEIGSIPKVVVPKKKKLEGFAMLSNLRDFETVSEIYAEDGARITKPEFVVTISPLLGTFKEFDPWYFTTQHVNKSIIHLFGSAGAAVINIKQKNAALETGAKEIVPYVAEKLLEAYTTNLDIEKHYRNSIDHMYRKSGYQISAEERSLFHFIKNDPVLSKKFGVNTETSTIVLDYINVFESLNTGLRRDSEYPEIDKIVQLIATWIPNTKTAALVNKLQDNKLVSMLNDNFFNYYFGDVPDNLKKIARDTIVKIVLKGNAS